MAVLQSTASAPGIDRSAAWLDWLQMLTGAALILFMWSHLMFLSTVIFGPGAMNALAAFFEDNYMVQTGGPVIFLVFIVHFVLAARKIPFRMKEQQVAYSHTKGFNHLDTRLWMVQVVSAMIVLIMGAAHMWVVLTDLPITAEKSAARVQNGFWMLFYLILLPMIELHVGIGFYRIGVKWGFIKRKDRKQFKSIEWGLTALFVAIGTITLIRFWTLAV